MAHHEDRFCRRRPWSDFIREVGSGGGGGLNCVNPETIPTSIYREIIYIEQKFFTSDMM